MNISWNFKNVNRAFKLCSLSIMNLCPCHVCNNIDWNKRRLKQQINQGSEYFISPSYRIGYSNFIIRCCIDVKSEQLSIQYMDSCPNDSGAVLTYEINDIINDVIDLGEGCILFNLDLFR